MATHDAPPADSGGRATNGSLARCIPIALATLATPKNLVSGSWHVARLLHPDERCAWGAVAVNVAASRLLGGYRDFVPEVIDVLRANEAPAELVEAVRSVPFRRKDGLPVMADPGYVVHTVEIALWFAYHEPLLERGLTWLVNAGGDTDTNAAVAGALMGARDGAGAIPAHWRAAVARAEYLEALADALLGLAPAP
jgi:ADP-ribosyl-[dinitrogen reductase] hydrolase